jgi:repressor LexA
MITPRQLDVLRFVERYIRAHQYAPTLREIAAALGISRVTALAHLRKLEAAQYIRRRTYRHRDIEVIRSPRRLRVIGRIAAGHPIEAVEDEIDVDVPEGTEGETFALLVQGDSMIDDQIRSGDYVICRRAETAHNGQTVVALLDGGEATLKRFYREGDRMRLQPANPRMKPILVDRVRIQGVVVGLYRDYAKV